MKPFLKADKATYFWDYLGCIGFEIVNEVEEPTTGDKAVVSVVVEIALVLLPMPVDITWHEAYLHHI